MPDSIPKAPPSPKEDIIASTEQILWSGGIHAATVRAITGLAGTNQASINYHFGSQEALFGVVCVRRMQPANKAIVERLKTPEDQVEVVRVEEIFAPLVETALGIWVRDDVLRALRSTLFFDPPDQKALPAGHEHDHARCCHRGRTPGLGKSEAGRKQGPPRVAGPAGCVPVEVTDEVPIDCRSMFDPFVALSATASVTKTIRLEPARNGEP
jgi:AcrR family transcriptional regulator